MFGSKCTRAEYGEARNLFLNSGFRMSSNFLTPKAIANRMKAKGLQRLRWWCELCQKQCRDENGFKQHATSEGHLRNMQLYAHNPKKFQDQFSMEFKNNFLRELSRRHSTNRIKVKKKEEEDDKQESSSLCGGTNFSLFFSFFLRPTLFTLS